MTPKEVNRFLNTLNALEPRRLVYKHPEDETEIVVALIREALVKNQNRVLDIFTYVKDIHPIGKLRLKEILSMYEDDLWDFTRGDRTTKSYNLIQK